jgi:hypothetical protein
MASCNDNKTPYGLRGQQDNTYASSFAPKSESSPFDGPGVPKRQCYGDNDEKKFDDNVDDDGYDLYAASQW